MVYSEVLKSNGFEIKILLTKKFQGSELILMSNTLFYG